MSACSWRAHARRENSSRERGRSARAAAEPVQLSTLPFGGATGTAITGGDAHHLLLRRRRWSVVLVAGHRHRTADPLGDEPPDDHDTFTSGSADRDPVTEAHRTRRAGFLAVDRHVSGAAGRRRLRTTLDEPHSRDPGVHAYVVRIHEVSLDTEFRRGRGTGAAGGHRRHRSVAAGGVPRGECCGEPGTAGECGQGLTTEGGTDSGSPPRQEPEVVLDRGTSGRRLTSPVRPPDSVPDERSRARAQTGQQSRTWKRCRVLLFSAAVREGGSGDPPRRPGRM